MKCYASDLVKKALAEVGYKEKQTNENLNDKTANAGSNNFNKYANYIDTKYPNFYNGKKNGYAWCDVFVDCMFIWTFGYEEALRLLCQGEKSTGASCTSSYNYFKWADRISDEPSIGAQVFFTKDGKTSYHTGIVVALNNFEICVVEGNSADGVRKVIYSRNSKLILGYGVPNYDPEESKGVVEIKVSRKQSHLIKIELVD